MFNNLFKRNSTEATDIAFSGELRKGMWVHSQSLNRIGIVTGNVGKHVAVDLVNDKGETTESVAVQAGTLQQARFSQIPDNRKPEQSAAMRFGYFN